MFLVDKKGNILPVNENGNWYVQKIEEEDLNYSVSEKGEKNNENKDDSEIIIDQKNLSNQNNIFKEDEDKNKNEQQHNINVLSPFKEEKIRRRR